MSTFDCCVLPSRPFKLHSVSHSTFKTKHFCHHIALLRRFSNHLTQPLKKPNIITFTNPFNQSLIPITRCKNHNSSSSAISYNSKNSDNDIDSCGFSTGSHNPEQLQEEAQGKSFWGAVGLIIGTAIGPGMLGLPAATIKSGPLPSTIVIILSWVYVISSIILVAELSFAAMEEDGVAEVSFTSLANKALGGQMGSFVALVYASLTFALLVACVSGIGSFVSQWFPWLNPVISHALFPLAVGITLQFFPFKTIDIANRFLCLIMLFSITGLVAIGLLVGRTNILGCFGHASWDISSILPAIPVTVLTLGFHVITPFICKIAGRSVHEARKAILFGGAAPLIMVLSWNLIVLGLSRASTASSAEDPISLLLSVNPSALPAVQGFAFSALATSFIGYSVSFPKQLVDTCELILGEKLKPKICTPNRLISVEDEAGKVGFVTYSGSGHNIGNAGKISDSKSMCITASDIKLRDGLQSILTQLILSAPVLIASFFPTTFSRALDFAGIYPNCFLFGILPPVMAYIYQSRKKLRSSILPGGNGALLLLFGIAVVLGIWH